MENIKFSIIIPFFNKEKALDICLKSILMQSYPKDRYEIICVDNNSTDESCSIVKRYPSVILIHSEKQGAYAARNEGILRSKGSLLVFTDADIAVEKNWLENIDAAVSKNDYDILIGWYVPACHVRLLYTHSHIICEKNKEALKENKPSLLTVSASNLMVKKDIFEKEGLFIDAYRGEDKYFVLRCFEKGYAIGFDDSTRVKRHDICSIMSAVRKNFTYGCVNELYVKRNRPGRELPDAAENICFTLKGALKYFPYGIAVLFIPLFYCIGSCFGKFKKAYDSLRCCM